MSQNLVCCLILIFGQVFVVLEWILRVLRQLFELTVQPLVENIEFSSLSFELLDTHFLQFLLPLQILYILFHALVKQSLAKQMLLFLVILYLFLIFALHLLAKLQFVLNLFIGIVPVALHRFQIYFRKLHLLRFDIHDVEIFEILVYFYLPWLPLLKFYRKMSLLHLFLLVILDKFVLIKNVLGGLRFLFESTIGVGNFREMVNRYLFLTNVEVPGLLSIFQICLWIVAAFCIRLLFFLLKHILLILDFSIQNVFSDRRDHHFVVGLIAFDWVLFDSWSQ